MDATPQQQETEIEARWREDRSRYELVDGGSVVGKAHYVEFEDGAGPERIFYHTTVDEAYGGRGLAGKLAGFALQDTVAQGRKIVPVCPYIKAYLPKHPEFAQDTRPVRPAHLEALPAE